VRAVSTELAPTPAFERSWWLRAPLVLVAPRAIFAALRDESEEAIEARQEPLLLMRRSQRSRRARQPDLPPHVERQRRLARAGPGARVRRRRLYAATLLARGRPALRRARRLGGEGTWRRARHVLALAATPLALSLLTFWPIRIAVYGQDLFRTGGDDYGRGDGIFGAVFLGFVAWSVWLLVVGVRTVHGWTWGRAAAAVGLAACVPVLIVLAVSL